MKTPLFKLLALSFLIAIVLAALPGLSSAGKEKTEKGTPAAESSTAEGEALFKKNCNMCHFPDKTDKKIGPGLKDLFKNKALPESHKEAT